MGKDTAIAWTHHTFNPWWGCVKIAPECAHCYAETFAKRTGHKVWGPGGERRFFGDKHWNEPIAWDRAAAEAGERRRVFCGSMCDVFEHRTDLFPVRERLWSLIHETPHLDWLLLTKRPENIRGFLPGPWGGGWPNVWLGTSAGCQPSLDKNLPHLLDLDAAVLFLSAEPLIGPLGLPASVLGRLDWIIVGGESGPKCRPMETHWSRYLCDASRMAGIRFFMKQLGGHPDKRDRLEDFPEDLRIREFPTPRTQP
jgi:protein gp37